MINIVKKYLQRKIQELNTLHCTKKMKFSIKDYFSKCDQIGSFPQFTKEIFNGKLHFLRSVDRMFRSFLVTGKE